MNLVIDQLREQNQKLRRANTVLMCISIFLLLMVIKLVN